MDRQGAEVTFKEYMARLREVRLCIQEDADYCCIAWDDVFNLFGEGSSSAEAQQMLEETLEDYLTVVLDCSEETIRKHVDLIVDLVSNEEGEDQCLSASPL